MSTVTAAPKKAVSVLSAIKAGATSKKAKVDEKPRLNLPENMVPLAKAFVQHVQAMDSNDAMSKGEKDQIASIATEFIFEECRRRGSVLSSVTVAAEDVALTFTRDKKYCDITKEQKEVVAAVFGEETEKFFLDTLEIKMKPASMTEDILGALIEATGEAFFHEHFDTVIKTKPTDTFHHNFMTDPAFRERCQGLVDAAIIKLYAPSLKLA